MNAAFILLNEYQHQSRRDKTVTPFKNWFGTDFCVSGLLMWLTSNINCDDTVNDNDNEGRKCYKEKMVRNSIVGIILVSFVIVIHVFLYD